jgi:hypothetical protein
MPIENEYVLDILCYPDCEDGEATRYSCMMYSPPVRGANMMAEPTRASG